MTTDWESRALGVIDAADSAVAAAQTHYIEALTVAEIACVWRDRAVLAARNEGWSFGRIASACGLSRSRVAQICDHREKS